MQQQHIETKWGAIRTPYYDDSIVGLLMDDLHSAGRKWTRENNPERLHLVGCSAPF
jgi:hypothetical protein